MPSAVYNDDPTIPNDAHLWRRIPKHHFVYDENIDEWRPSSAAFEDDTDGSPMSVFLATILQERGEDANAILVGHEDFAVASITAGLARSRSQMIVRDPLPESPAHALVVGNKTYSVRKEFAKKCEWVVPATPSDESYSR